MYGWPAACRPRSSRSSAPAQEASAIANLRSGFGVRVLIARFEASDSTTPATDNSPQHLAPMTLPQGPAAATRQRTALGDISNRGCYS
jgi:hypothetical protein